MDLDTTLEAEEGFLQSMAVRVGFEPTEELPLRRFSRPEHSTALPPHHNNIMEPLMVPNHNSTTSKSEFLLPIRVS